MIVSKVTKSENPVKGLGELKPRVLLPEVLDVHADNAQNAMEALMVEEVEEVVKGKLEGLSEQLNMKKTL
jgi:hypothetical protein